MTDRLDVLPPPEMPPPSKSQARAAAPSRAAAPRPTRWRMEPARPAQRHWRRIGIGLTTLTLVTCGFLWVAGWFQPPRPVALVLIGAGYHDNLALPHNVYGWNSLEDLANDAGGGIESDSSYWARRLRGVTPQVKSLTGPWSWPRAIPTCSQPTCLIFISAHGASDSEGAYLLPDDATMSPAPRNRLRLAPLLTRLAELPAAQHKVLVLDVSHFEYHAPLGVLQNDFVAELKQLDEQIRAVPNLVVVSAADSQQRSWPCPSWGRTVFAHYWIEGLRGAAKDSDDDGRIMLDELAAFTTAQVADWTGRHCDSVQSPLLLPSGEEGLRRAARIHVAWKDDAYIPSAPSLIAPAAVPAPLVEVWQTAHDLANRLSPPYVSQPQTWRRYLAALRRYEELVRAGDRANSARLEAQVEQLAQACAHDPTIGLSSLDARRAASAYYTGDRAALAAQTQLVRDAQTILDTLSACPPAELADTWRKQAAAAGPALKPLRVEMYRLLAEQAIADPITRLDVVCRTARVIQDPLHPLPPELHLALMLQRDLPAEARGLDNLPLLTQALRVRRLAEQATSGKREGFEPASPLARPWIADEVAAGDVSRRLGEDLLFAGPAERAHAAEYLTQAEQHYRQALDDGCAVLHAFHTRDTALAILPEMSHSIGSLPWTNGKHPLLDEAKWTELERLWREVHALARQLTLPSAAHLHQPARIDAIAGAELASISERAALIDAAMQTLSGQIVSAWEDLADHERGADAYFATDLPTFPTLAVDVRRRGVERRLKQLEQRRADMRQTLAALGAERYASVPATADRATHIRNAQHAARARGRLSLAVMGEGLFAELQTTPDGSWEQAQHRLEVFAVESTWRSSLTALGQQIAARWRRLPRIVAMEEESRTDASGAAIAGKCYHADAWCRQVPYAFVAELDDSASEFLARLRLGRYLMWQAERQWQDHWYAVEVDHEPYYRALGLSLLSDAQSIAPPSREVNELQALLAASDNWAVQCAPRAALTPEEPLAIEVIIAPSATGFTPQGFATARWRLPQSLQVSKASDAPIAAPWPEKGGPLSLATKVAIAPTDKKAESDTRSTATARLELLYRGRRLTQELPIDIHHRPDFLVRQSPAPAQSSLVVTTSPALQSEFGAGRGAVAIVLDASGSMGAKRGQPFDDHTRYAQATAALQQVLGRLPPGTELSVWIFGQSVGGKKTVKEAEKTVLCLRPLAPWNPHDQAALAQLMQRVSHPAVEPWNESAVVHAILAAKRELAAAQGFKTIVAITDGLDNRYEQDKVANPERHAVATALVENFRASGVALNIVGFQIASHEEQAARAQFAVIESLSPPGRFYRVDQSGDLVAALGSALDQRLRFWVEDYDQRLLGGLTSAGREVSATQEALTAAPLALLPGEARLRLWAGSPLMKDVSLRAGEQLLTVVTQRSGRQSLERLPVLETFYRDRPTRLAGDWRAAVLASTLDSQQQACLQVALERTPVAAEARLARVMPHDVWWEVATPPGAERLTVASELAFNSPVPAWRLTFAPPAGTGAGFAPQVAGWWLAERDVPAAMTLVAGEDFKQLDELDGRALTINGQCVRIEDVRVEQRVLPAADGQLTPQPCLMIVLAGAPNDVVWLRPIGLEVAGCEHRHYASIGRYCGLFWPVRESDLKTPGVRLEFATLADLKRAAERRGTHVKFDAVALPTSP